MLQLSVYNSDIVYSAGARQKHTDELSRNPVDMPKDAKVCVIIGA